MAKKSELAKTLYYPIVDIEHKKVTREEDAFIPRIWVVEWMNSQWVNYNPRKGEEDVKIAYRVIIGYPQLDGLHAGETRARLVSNRYLLENTFDNLLPSLEETSDTDNRRFQIFKPGIVDKREEARVLLRERAREYARYLNNKIKLGVLDRTKDPLGLYGVRPNLVPERGDSYRDTIQGVIDFSKNYKFTDRSKLRGEKRKK